MSTDESLEEYRKRGAESVASKAIEWGNLFLKALEIEYGNAAAELPAQAAWAEYRQAMIRAFGAALIESGADPSELGRLIQDIVPRDQLAEKSVGWTSELNARRIELIDKMIQQSLSEAEAAEFGQLTARLRLHVDNEELVPLQGARQLHRRLLEHNNRGAQPE